MRIGSLGGIFFLLEIAPFLEGLGLNESKKAVINMSPFEIMANVSMSLQSPQSKKSQPFLCTPLESHNLNQLNPNALRMAKTQWSFGHSECNRVKVDNEGTERIALTQAALTLP